MLKNREFIEWLRNNAYLCSRKQKWKDLSSLQPRKKMLKHNSNTSLISHNLLLSVHG